MLGNYNNNSFPKQRGIIIKRKITNNNKWSYLKIWNVTEYACTSKKNKHINFETESRQFGFNCSILYTSILLND